MKRFAVFTFLSLAAVAPAVHAQSWEVGGAAGGSFFTSESVKSAVSGSADAKFGSGFIASAWFGNNIGNVLGGEIRYDYEDAPLRLSGPGGSASFAGHTNAIHYDFLFHFAPKEASVRPFIAAGAGVKVYTGSGAESASQPLSQFAFLTKTSQLEPVVSVGAGVKFNLGRITTLRLDVHDYLSPFPQNVIAPAPGAKISGWVNNFVLEAGLSFGS